MQFRGFTESDLDDSYEHDLEKIEMWRIRIWKLVHEAVYIKIIL